MADRLRANSGGAIQGITVNQGYNRPRTTLADATYNTPKPDCRSVGCQPDQMALDDLADLAGADHGPLPGGIGVVCIDSGTLGAPTFNGTTLDSRCDGVGVSFAVKIFWLDNRGETATAVNTNEAYSSFVTRINPTL